MFTPVIYQDQLGRTSSEFLSSELSYKPESALVSAGLGQNWPNWPYPNWKKKQKEGTPPIP
jgi:hypothetical protein